MRLRIRQLAFALVAALACICALPLASAHPKPYSVAKTYQVGVAQTSFVDIMGLTVPCTIFYPSAKANGGALQHHARFPGVVFLQGFDVPASEYSWIIDLAANGYIVALPDRPPITLVIPFDPPISVTGIITSVDVMDRSIALLDDLGRDPASPLFGRLEPKIAVAGHSLGGDVLLVGMDPLGCLGHPNDEFYAGCAPGYAPNPLFQAGIVLAGAHSALEVAPSLPLLKPFDGFPVYMVSAENDPLPTTNPLIMQRDYNRLSEPKYYFDIGGGNHYGFTDTLSFPFDGVATIPREQQLSTAVDLMTVFLDCSFGGKNRACSRIPTTEIAP